MSLGKIVLGTLTGLAVGAMLGVLFAPDKGSNTRKKISKKREEFAENLKEKFDEFVDKVSAKAEEFNETVEQEIEDVKGQVKEKFKAKA
jgi:gas vesicle protein